MKKAMYTLLLGVLLAAPLGAQSLPASSLDLAVTYDATRNGADSFWLQGGGVQAEGRFQNGFGVVASVNGLHNANMHGSGVGLDLVTATFGPRYHWQPGKVAPALGKRLSLYGEAQAGVANGFHGLFPVSGVAEDSATGFAFRAGGGVDYKLNQRFSVRVLDAGWLRTSLPNNANDVQNNLHLGAGLVWRVR